MLPLQPPADARAAFSDYLRPGVMAAAGEGAADVADAVASFVAGSKSAPVIADGPLTALVARALCGAGRSEAARAWVSDRISDPVQGRAYLDLAGAGAFTTETAHLIGSGLLAPASWAAASPDPLWILDARRVDFGPGPALELAEALAWRRLVEAAAPAWDASAGRGVLGLRGLPTRATGGVMAYAGHVLQVVARRRGWVEAPRVVRIDAA